MGLTIRPIRPIRPRAVSGCRSFAVELWNKPGPRTNPKRAADRIRDAVPLRMGLPRTDWPQDVMIIGICPKDGI